MNGRTPHNLLRILDKHFDTVALRELAYEMGADYENLVGENKRARFLSLIQYAEQRDRIDELLQFVVERRPFLRKELKSSAVFASKSIWGRMSLGTKVTIMSIIVTIIGIVVTLATFFPETLGITPKATSTPANRILLQIQVNSVEDLSAVANAKVTLNVAEQIFAPQRTDSNGRAVFAFSTEMAGKVAHITVEANSQIETQNITIDVEMRAVEFQIRP